VNGGRKAARVYSSDDSALSARDDTDAGVSRDEGVDAREMAGKCAVADRTRTRDGGRLLAFSTVAMVTAAAFEPDVYDAREIAAAGGRRADEVARLIDSGRVATLDGVHVSHAEALRVLRALRSGRPLEVATPTPTPPFACVAHRRRQTRLPLLASTAVHGALLGAALLGGLIGRSEVTEAVGADALSPVRLVFLARPGEGGGGGGGGRRQPTPPASARREGHHALTSPVPPPLPPAPVAATPPPQPSEPPPRAPVASVAADVETTAGVLDPSSQRDSRGAGRDGLAGTGSGGGLGQGDGDGIGEGAGGGTGGGPYRPGSGIEPPSLLREVKPDYSEEARRRSVEGDVVLEIVVRRDGSVGDVRLRRALGSGLDQRAIEAVRRWQFTPARRRGAPVDVLVEVAVEFKLR
jgi:protein TonB